METGTEKEYNAALTLQDRIRLELNSYGKKRVPLTVADLAMRLSIPRNYDVYQALKRLNRLGELEFEKDEQNRIVGINVNKLEPSGRTYQRAAEVAKSNVKRITQITSEESLTDGMTALKEYLQQKLAIFDMQAKATEAGLDPEQTVKFDPNPYAEEGLILLKLVSDINKELVEVKAVLKMTEYDLVAERRNVDFLKAKNKDNTRSDLFASAAAAS